MDFGSWSNLIFCEIIIPGILVMIKSVNERDLLKLTVLDITVQT